MKIITIVLFLLISLNCFSQNMQVIDTVKILCSYKYVKQLDTITGRTNDDLIYLQVGTKCSKSFSYYTFQCDSLKSTPQGEKRFKQLFKEAYEKGGAKEVIKTVPNRRSTMYVFKNYPEGTITVLDNILGSYYIYNDNLELQDWTFNIDSVKTILGHQCQIATCDFRGRHWTAWFAVDIPISDGPWKFRGLPGLIMEVYDRNYQHHFCLNGLQGTVATPMHFGIYRKDVIFEKTDQSSFLKALYNWDKNYNSFTEAMTGISLGKSESEPRRDFLEREEK